MPNDLPNNQPLEARQRVPPFESFVATKLRVHQSGSHVRVIGKNSRTLRTFALWSLSLLGFTVTISALACLELGPPRPEEVWFMIKLWLVLQSVPTVVYLLAAGRHQTLVYDPESKLVLVGVQWHGMGDNMRSFSAASVLLVAGQAPERVRDVETLDDYREVNTPMRRLMWGPYGFAIAWLLGGKSDTKCRPVPAILSYPLSPDGTIQHDHPTALLACRSEQDVEQSVAILEDAIRNHLTPANQST